MSPANLLTALAIFLASIAGLGLLWRLGAFFVAINQ